MTVLLQVDPHLHTYVENLKRQEAASEATSTITEQQQQRPKQQQGAVQACSITLHSSASVGSSTAAAAPKGDYLDGVWYQRSGFNMVSLSCPEHLIFPGLHSSMQGALFLSENLPHASCARRVILTRMQLAPTMFLYLKLMCLAGGALSAAVEQEASSGSVVAVPAHTPPLLPPQVCPRPQILHHLRGLQLHSA